MLYRLSLAICLSLFAIFANVAQAQDSPNRAAISAPDYATWESVASRAEVAIDGAQGSNSVYETLRARLDSFRQTFAAARGINEGRIATLRAQIEALGPPPAEGASETAEIAERRALLTTQLNEALAPVQAAQEAFTRADGLINQIDRILRERQTERLLSLSPSPLNPVIWPTALDEFGTALSAIWQERRTWVEPVLLEDARENLPLSLLLLAVGVVLLARGRAWAGRLGTWLRGFGGRGSGVWTFVVSLFRIILPVVGLYMLTQAFLVTGLAGRRGAAMLQILPLIGFVILSFRWLAERLFARNDDDAILLLQPERRTEARFYLTFLGIVVGVRAILEVIFQLSDMTIASRAVIAFPLEVLIALTVVRFGQLLSKFRPEAEPDEDGASSGVGRMRLVRFAGLAAQAVGVIAPALMAVGYAAAGQAMLEPFIFSMALLGFVMTLQRFIGDVYGLLSGQGQAGRDSLVVVFLSFTLFLAAGPFLALLWGARVTDLLELWETFLQGFSIGDTRVSPTDFLTFILVFAIGYLLTRVVQNALKTQVLPKTRIDVGGQNALLSGLGYIGIFLAAVIAITTAGIDLSGIALLAGALSVGIGFGLQNIVSNFVAGIILLIERPISEGDWIEVGGTHGTVRSISVRSTRIETFDRSDVIVPNSEFVSGTVTNYTRGNTVGRLIIPVGVAYGTDTRKVETILREIADAHPMVTANPTVVFMAFGASSLDFEIRAILRDVNFILSVRNELNHEIARRFHEEGIEIPFPQQDVWLRNPQALAPPDATAEDSSLEPVDDTAEPGDISEASDDAAAEDGQT